MQCQVPSEKARLCSACAPRGLKSCDLSQALQQTGAHRSTHFSLIERLTISCA